MLLTSTDLKICLPQVLAKHWWKDYEEDSLPWLSSTFKDLSCESNEGQQNVKVCLCQGHLRKTKKNCDNILFVNEVRGEAQGRGGSWCRPLAVSWSHPDCYWSRIKKPCSQLALAGVSSSGACIIVHKYQEQRKTSQELRMLSRSLLF